MTYVLEMPVGLRLFAGIAEALAGLALVFPMLLGVLPWLTPLAAAGLVLLMVGAIVLHIVGSTRTSASTSFSEPSPR
jgi:hypothetical protein